MEEVETPEQFKAWAKKRNIELIDSLGDLHVGDTVKYTNEFGVSFFPRTIVGIQKDDSFYGRQIYLAKDAWWFPVKPEEVSKKFNKGGILNKKYKFKDLFK